ncbi:hypothetical protein ACPPVQ_11570 [Diaminobutyricibacter sp. McL0618]|uniref:hypothetical protein n=1 Tax=Leifsonia sp. McL0618 TaxID=3415677 RepID=UPI003CF31C08
MSALRMARRSSKDRVAALRGALLTAMTLVSWFAPAGVFGSRHPGDLDSPTLRELFLGSAQS